MQSVTRYHGADSLKPKVSAFYDATSGTFSYVVQDPSSSACAIIDPLLDFDLNSGELQHRSADAIVRYVESKRLQVQWLIETHVHTDHLSAAQYLKDVLGGKTAIAGAVCKEQRHYADLLNLPRNFKTVGPGKICPTGTNIRHQQRISCEHRIADQMRHATESMPGSIDGRSLHIANQVVLGIAKQAIEL